MADSNSETKAPAKKAAAKKTAPAKKSANPYPMPEDQAKTESTEASESTEENQDKKLDLALLGETLLTYAPSANGPVVVPAIVTRVNVEASSVDLYVLPSFGGSESRHYTNVSVVDAEPDEPGVISANRCAWTR